jgi:2-oxoglutarate dehydrogenase E1 component
MPRLGVNLPPVSADFVVDLYHRHLRNPGAVDPGWTPYFDAFFGGSATLGGSAPPKLEAAAVHLLEAFRQRGHFAAKLDPLGLWSPPDAPELRPDRYGIDAEALDTELEMPTAIALEGARTIRRLVARLTEIYCGSIGFDCAHVDNPTARQWLYAVAEGNEFAPDRALRRNAAERLIEADEFEQFLNRRFIGKKRFGAEGAEAVVPWFDALLARCAALGVEDVVIGATARCRLNVMANALGKSLTALLYELKGHRPFPADMRLSGDVPYHFGHVGERTYDTRNIRITLCHNPSHLEAIDGVTLGRTRARQAACATLQEGVDKTLGLQVHTDAAFAGQGLVAEVLQLSRLPHYATGGSIHVVINNQVGFTTDPLHGRSSIFCTDVARTVGAPVLHVNGDDVDAVVRTALIAAEYRKRFRSDIVVDLVCYRRRGHNEVDEPTFTQPAMYRKVADHPSVRQTYLAAIAAEGVMTQEEIERNARDCFERLDAAYKAIEGYRPNRIAWKPEPEPRHASAPAMLHPPTDETGVAPERLKEIGRALCAHPQGFAVNAKVVRMLAERLESIETGENIAWATGEALAFASLAAEGTNVRFSGQDAPRGAFSQRHFVLVDQNDGALFNPFDTLGKEQGRCDIIGSPLSEYSVLGFEYGYAMDAARSLVVWEAQFGDFANVAQVVIDQFVTSGEDKWAQNSSVTLMLPHGLEGQGPDHSSGRIERFLQMCAGENITVANCSTPANLFHLLRRQARDPSRRPLVIFTPKSLLRHKRAVSRLAEFSTGTRFQPVMAPVATAAKVERVVLCTGKVYYDLLAAAEETGDPVAIIRLEQLYPFPREALAQALSRYPEAEVVWCQEEPANMGAWSFLDRKIEGLLRINGNRCAWPHLVSRPENASNAIGTTAEHDADQLALAREAVDIGLRRQATAGRQA